MIQNRLAQSNPRQEPQKRGYHYSSTAAYRRLNQRLNQNRHVRTKRLPLSNYERKLIEIGSIIVVALMLVLISSKISSGVDQQHCQTLTTKISRLRSQNSDLQARISDLQDNHRLYRVAHQNKLTPASNKNVRNVR